MVFAPPDDPAADPLGQLLERVDRAGGLAALDGNDAGLYTEIELGGERAFDAPFWRERAPARYLERVARNRIPAMLISGWFDIYQRGVPLSYSTLQNAWAGRRDVFAPMRPRQRATPRYQLVQGPWLHNAVGMGEWIQQLHLEWFDRWLLGRRTALTRMRRPLHAFELGDGRWVDAASYPLPQARSRRVWLDGGRSGTAPLSLNDGALSWERPEPGSDRIAGPTPAAPAPASPTSGAWGSSAPSRPTPGCRSIPARATTARPRPAPSSTRWRRSSAT